MSCFASSRPPIRFRLPSLIQVDMMLTWTIQIQVSSGSGNLKFLHNQRSGSGRLKDEIYGSGRTISLLDQVKPEFFYFNLRPGQTLTVPILGFVPAKCFMARWRLFTYFATVNTMALALYYVLTILYVRKWVWTNIIHIHHQRWSMPWSHALI